MPKTFVLQISGDLKGIPDADQHVAYLDQYVLEFQPDEKTRETKFSILDEGRIEIVPNSTKEIHPGEVTSPRPSGILDPDFYPKEDVPAVITYH